MQMGFSLIVGEIPLVWPPTTTPLVISSHARGEKGESHGPYEWGLKPRSADAVGIPWYKSSKTLTVFLLIHFWGSDFEIIEIVRKIYWLINDFKNFTYNHHM